MAELDWNIQKVLKMLTLEMILEIFKQILAIVLLAINIAMLPGAFEFHDPNAPRNIPELKAGQ